MDKIESRKNDHIELAFKARAGSTMRDARFHYEPLLSAHPANETQSFPFLGKILRAPIWVSSMTGGTKLAGTINKNLAQACKEFGMGMGLGSCRILLDDDRYFEDFNVRPLIGNEQPLWANLGIAQVEKLLKADESDRISDLVSRLQADGLIIHVNPVQEWLQPGGDTLEFPPIETISRFLEKTGLPVIVKEVGQGMGPDSLRLLLDLPLAAIEFAAFGGTNFAIVEILRQKGGQSSPFEPFTRIGEDPVSMLENINRLNSEKEASCKSLIISGGIRNFLDGYYLLKRSRLPAIFGMASAFLEHARGDYRELQSFTESQITGLKMAEAYLRVKE